jgi:hypothetical protein
MSTFLLRAVKGVPFLIVSALLLNTLGPLLRSSGSYNDSCFHVGMDATMISKSSSGGRHH